MGKRAPVETSPGGRARAVGLIAAACWLAPIALSAVSSPDTVDGRRTGNVASLLFAPLFLLLATGAGNWLLDRAVRLREDFIGRWVLAAGLGLGAFSLGTLLVGVVALPPTVAVWGVLLILAVLLARRCGGLLIRLWARFNRFREERTTAEAVLVVLIGFLVMLNVLRAFVPPLEYDELEYHLAAPARYVRADRIGFLEDNAYASFPANVEMLFLDAMLLRGGVTEGLALGRLVNVMLGLLAACAAAACAAAVFSPSAAVPAAAILYTWPRVNSLAHVGYVELGLMLYVGLALLAAYQYRASGAMLRHLVLLGVTCGLAAGCKYPAVLFLWVPAAGWVLYAAGRKWLRHGLLFAAAALVTFSPWLVRNTVNTGNPVYPLLGAVFDSPTWSARKEARWAAEHSPKGYAPADLWRATWKAITERYPHKDKSPHSMSVLLAAFWPLVFCRGGWRKKGVVLLALALLGAVFWLLLTHRIARFIVPWLVPLVLVNAAGAVALARHERIHVFLTTLFVLMCAVQVWSTYVVRAPANELEFFRGRATLESTLSEAKAESQGRGGISYDHDAIRFINALPAGSCTLFYGEARTLYCTADVVAPTVFDENPLDDVVRAAETPDDIRAGLATLRERGVTHLYVNLAELHRLQCTYFFHHDGRDWHGYSTLFDNRQQVADLAGFLHTYCTLVHPDVGPKTKRMLDAALLFTMGQHKRDRIARAPTAFYVYQIADAP